MTGPLSECQVRLHRDALNTPWGVRLQGGKDFNVPLTVQRVFVGSPADGELHRGDVIVAIQNYDATTMLHKQAQDLIKQAGGSLSLRIRRSAQVRAQSAPTVPATQAYRSRPLDTFSPKSPTTSGGGVMSHGYTPKHVPRHLGGGGPSFGVDYTHQHHHHRPAAPVTHQQYQLQPAPPAVQDSMLNRVSQSLNQAVVQSVVADQDYEQKSVHDLMHTFNQPPPAQVHRARPPPQSRRGVTWKKPEPGTTGGGLPEFGQVYGRTPQHGHRKVYYQPPAPTAPAHSAAPAHTGYSPQSYVPKEQHDYQPSWKGSLKSSGGPKPWEIREQKALVSGEDPAPVQPFSPRVQNVHYGPGGSSPQYQQHAPEDHTSDTATVQHLQYNSPLGLYSKQNVEDALVGQTRGKPGEGTMQVVSPGGGGGSHPGQKKGFNPATSDVLRMVTEEDEVRKMRSEHGFVPSDLPEQHQHHQQQQQQHQHHGYGDYHQGHSEPAQSRSMHALEARFGDIDMGTSDF